MGLDWRDRERCVKTLRYQDTMYSRQISSTTHDRHENGKSTQSVLTPHKIKTTGGPCHYVCTQLCLDTTGDQDKFGESHT